MSTKKIIDKPQFKHSNNWRGGRYKSRGYWYIWKPNYLRSHKNNYVREHIYIFQEHYKCCLLEWGNVHHKNGKRDDNRIQNLQGLTRKQHRRLHMIGNKCHNKDMTNRFCLICDNKTWISSDGRQYWFKYKDGFICRKCYRSK